MKKNHILLAVAALFLVVSASVGTAYSYFTTYARTTGGYTIELGDRTTIEEEFDSWTKRVTIKVSDDSQPVFIRAIAFGPDEYPLEISGDGWTEGGDGYWYYNEAVPAGESTSVLNVKITDVPKATDVTDEQEFNVVVNYETTPARYDEDGNPKNTPDDWAAAKVQTGKWEGGMTHD